MWFGCWRDKIYIFFNFRWLKEFICVFGIYFLYNIEDVNKLNFEEKINNLEKIFNGWK